jgi:hypothetical protein
MLAEYAAREGEGAAVRDVRQPKPYDKTARFVTRPLRNMLLRVPEAPAPCSLRRTALAPIALLQGRGSRPYLHAA